MHVPCTCAMHMCRACAVPVMHERDSMREAVFCQIIVDAVKAVKARMMAWDALWHAVPMARW